MTNLKSINPRDLAPDGLPLFLGDPTAKPNQVLPEYPWNFYLAAIGLIAEKYDHLFPDPANYQLREFIECANIDGPELFEESFIRWYKIREYWGPGPKEAFAALINQLRDPKKSSLYKIHPRLIDRELSPEKPNHQVDTGREISPKPIPQHGPKTATQVSKSKNPTSDLLRTVGNGFSKTSHGLSASKFLTQSFATPSTKAAPKAGRYTATVKLTSFASF